jgi:hypothetical protein
MHDFRRKTESFRHMWREGAANDRSPSRHNSYLQEDDDQPEDVIDTGLLVAKIS